MRSSKTPLSFDDDTDEILSHSLSRSVVSLKTFSSNKTRLPNAFGRRQHKENLSRALSWNTFSFAFVLETRFKKCLSTRENFRAFNNDDLLFFLGQKQPVWVEKDARNYSRAFAFKSRKRSIRMNGVISFSLSLSLERARGGTLVKTQSRLKGEKPFVVVECTTSRVVGSFRGGKRV